MIPNQHMVSRAITGGGGATALPAVNESFKN